MYNDPIMEEVRKNREEFAAQFNFDLDAMVKSLQESERKSGRQMVSFSPKMYREALPEEESPCGTIPSEFRGHHTNLG
ncbi:MAG: hypothetical protein H7839_13250 [Magnetococcus sp. YQC-5]